MNHSKVKLTSFLALGLVSLALVCSSALPLQDASAAFNGQHPHPTPTPHPAPHPSPHPIAQPTFNPGPQSSPHPSPHPGPNPVPAPNQDPPVLTVQPRDGVATSPAMMIGTARIKVNTRPAIQFVPFELSDVQTRKHQAMTLDSELTLNNGVQMTVSKYLDQINEYERGFNALGYTLRGEPRVIELQELEPETTVLPVTTGQDRSDSRITTKTIPELDREFRDQMVNSQDRAQILAGLPPATAGPPSVFLKPKEDSGPPEYQIDDSLWGRGRPGPLGKPPSPPPPPPPGTIGRPRPFSQPWAIKGFRIVVKGEIDNRGTTDYTTVIQKTSATATIFGWTVPLMSLASTLNASRNGELGPDIQLTVASNNDTITLSDTNPSGAQWMRSGGEVSREFLDLKQTFRFSIGPIPASVTIGITGTAGVRNYWAGLRPLYARAQYTPFTAANVYAKGGPDLGVVNFGVRGDLNLLKYEIALASECNLRFSPFKRERFLWEEYSANGTLSTLSGKISMYACVDLLVGDFCFDQKLADFRGYDLSNSAIIPLGANRVDLPMAPAPQPAIRQE